MLLTTSDSSLGVLLWPPDPLFLISDPTGRIWPFKALITNLDKPGETTIQLGKGHGDPGLSHGHDWIAWKWRKYDEWEEEEDERADQGLAPSSIVLRRPRQGRFAYRSDPSGGPMNVCLYVERVDMVVEEDVMMTG